MDKCKLAVLAIGEHPNLCAEKFADIHQKKLESTKTVITEPFPVKENPNIPLNDKLDNIENDYTSPTSEQQETGLDDVIKLHKEVSSDIEFWLRNGNPNFIKCYRKYLETYKKIVNKTRGQAPINSRASANVAFGRNKNKRIRVQPTTISCHRSGIKSSCTTFRPKPTLVKKEPKYDAGQ